MCYLSVYQPRKVRCFVAMKIEGARRLLPPNQTVATLSYHRVLSRPTGSLEESYLMLLMIIFMHPSNYGAKSHSSVLWAKRRYLGIADIF